MGVTLSLTTGAVLAAVVGVAVGARWRPSERVGWAQLRRGLAASAVGGAVVGAVVGVVADLRIFGLVHLVYLGLTVTLPLLGLGVLALGVRRGSTRGVRLVAVALLLPAPVGAYATHVEPYRLQVDRVDVAVDPARAGSDPVRIAVLSDLQTTGVGPHERRAVDEVLAAEPDIILLPGDLYQGSRADLEDDLADLRQLVGRLRAPHGVYFVRGDVDGGGDDDAQGSADAILEGTDVRLLSDEVEVVRVGDRTLHIGGTRLDFGTASADAVRAELQDQPDDGAITILVSHRPDAMLALPPDSRVDLTVSGHTHGGPVVVPGYGPLVTLSAVPRDVARGGLHEVDGNRTYVSTGVGIQRGDAPQVRLFSPPTVSILTLAEPQG